MTYNQLSPIVIDNFIPNLYLQDLQSHFLSEHCEWYFNGKLTGDQSEELLSSYGFYTLLCWNRNFNQNYISTLSKGLIFSVQQKVEDLVQNQLCIVRARVDMTVFNPSNYRHELHTDFPCEHVAAIFYINSSDGNTMIFDRSGLELIAEIEPVENRLVIFDGLMTHTGHSPSKNKSRVLMNLNFMDTKTIYKLEKDYGPMG